jgi:hypothetical protein
MLTVSPELQNSGLGKIIATGKFMHRLGLPKIVMTVISLGKNYCLVQTSRLYRYGRKEPFPVSDIHISIVNSLWNLSCSRKIA